MWSEQKRKMREGLNMAIGTDIVGSREQRVQLRLHQTEKLKLMYTVVTTASEGEPIEVTTASEGEPITVASC